MNCRNTNRSFASQFLPSPSLSLLCTLYRIVAVPSGTLLAVLCYAMQRTSCLIVGSCWQSEKKQKTKAAFQELHLVKYTSFGSLPANFFSCNESKWLWAWCVCVKSVKGINTLNQVPVSSDVVVHSRNCRKEINVLANTTYHHNNFALCFSHRGE